MKPNPYITLLTYQMANLRIIDRKRHLLLALTALIALLICVDTASAVNGAFYMKKWGSQGTANGQFNNPDAVAIDSAGNIYVADTENHRIQKFTSSGTYVTQWGSYGSGNGQFNNPAAVAVRGLYVYVANTHNYRIKKFSTRPAVFQPL